MTEQLDYRGKPRSRYQTVNDEPSRTVQSDADRANIKHILGKYGGQFSLAQSLNQAQAQFMDVTGFTDLADALRQAKVAEAEFMRLPPDLRRVFHNDVAEWLDSAHDPEKQAKLVELGYLEAPKAVDPAPVEPVVPAP